MHRHVHRQTKSFNGEIITSCEAEGSRGPRGSGSIPLQGIIKRTEVTREVETVVDNSDAETHDQREGSTDRICSVGPTSPGHQGAADAEV